MKPLIVVLYVVCAAMLVGCGSVKEVGESIKEVGELVSYTDLKGNLSGDITEGAVIYNNARICDASGCYIAWNVVDSDGDGVCDADELVAGTNPFDPQSRPPLDVVAKLGGEKQLPSFEAGLGVFVVFPPDLLTMKEKYAANPLGDLAFPVDRGDSLTRLGISNELLNQYNIDLASDGLTFGPLSKPTDEGGNILGDIPEARVSGIEVSLISADKGAGTQDCCFPLLPLEPGKKEYPVDDPFGRAVVETHYSDGSVLTEFFDKDGNSLGGTYQDEDGNIVTTWYVNPDADQVTDTPTPEQEEAALRLRGAVSKTMENWYVSDPNGAEPPRNPRDLVILVDPDQYGTAVIYEIPRVSGAQPETRDDLPSPRVPADPGDFVGACVVGCP